MKTQNEYLFVVLASLLAREQLRCNVWDNTTLRDDDVAKEFVQLFIVTNGKLEMTGYDTRKR
jgi:hypothetical protein